MILRALPLVLLMLLPLAGCVTQPRLNAGISIGTGGLAVYPSLSGRVGGARIAVSP